jgi:hypothetical protein
MKADRFRGRRRQHLDSRDRGIGRARVSRTGPARERWLYSEGRAGARFGHPVGCSWEYVRAHWEHV